MSPHHRPLGTLLVHKQSYLYGSYFTFLVHHHQFGPRACRGVDHITQCIYRDEDVRTPADDLRKESPEYPTERLYITRH